MGQETPIFSEAFDTYEATFDTIENIHVVNGTFRGTLYRLEHTGLYTPTVRLIGPMSAVPKCVKNVLFATMAHMPSLHWINSEVRGEVTH